MKKGQTKAKTYFSRTTKAIRKIKQPSIRRDFTEMLAGVEYCLAKRQKRFARTCVRTLVGMAVGLNRTISPSITVSILDGLMEDGKNDPSLTAGLIDKHKNMGCINGECQSQTSSTCIEIIGAPGCGNERGFLFPWVRKA